ncbi:MAG TPA: hypothetical protein EYN79_05450 [Planctomycetes bacterium]|nr:hypothetical protein [Planctomycetota bacterium]
MSKQISLVLLGVLIGAVTVGLTMGGGPTTELAIGQSANGTNGFLLQSFKLQGRGDAEALALFDTNARKLVIYFQDSSGLQLMSVRDLQYDLVPQEYSARGKQKPTVGEMKKGVRKN